MKKLISLAGIFFIFLLVFALVSSAAEVKRTAKIVEIKGNASIKMPVSDALVPATNGMILNENDVIITAPESYVTLNVDGNAEIATVEVKPDSQVMLLELTKDTETNVEKTMLDLAIGKVLIKAKKLEDPKAKFEVKTPTSVVGVRGTDFSVEVEALE